ncbi:MAG: hypothetical protein GC179_05980 [Anaerolineaceae bacterium]|nr:hypothetical protein [Anaerolineaceae bacterium]
MLQPGLARAVPMGILGFIGGALLALVIRMLQGLDPAGSVGAAFVLGAFISSGVFVWGMGGFDPRMSVHGEHAEEEHAVVKAAPPQEPAPTSILGAFTWQVTFWTILCVLIIAVFAFLPAGPHIRNVHPGQGDVSGVGFVALGGIYQPIREFLQTATSLELLPKMSDELASLQVSYLILFIVFVAITMISLFLFGALFAGAVSYFIQGKKNPDSTSIAWRVLIFIFGVAAPLLTIPLLVSSREVPMAVVVPVFLLPPLLLLIAYRRPIWAILLLIGLALPVLVPTVKVTNIASVMFAVIGVGILAFIFNVLHHFLAERSWKIAAGIVLSIAVIGVLVYTVGLTRDDFWEMLFSVLAVIFSLLLILPVPYLKLIIPASMWAKFAAIKWMTLIPDVAGWLAEVLRTGLPSFLGQK